MITNLGIFVSIFIVSISGLYYDQYRVFRLQENFTLQTSNDHYDDAKIYFDAIKDTFDLYHRDKRYKNGTVCRSDQTHLDIGDKSTIYSKLKKNFNSSCSYVIGNVVIAHIAHEDITFLNSIKEISGYLFIFHNTARSISMKNLEVIRGENALLLNGEQFSLAVAANYYGSKQLEYLLLPNLQVIIRHDILILESPGLCYMNMIYWDSLIDGTQRVIISEKNENSCLVNSTIGGRRLCHSDCSRWADKQFCWSNGSDSCQKINECRNRPCSASDVSNKCYINPNYKTEQCCHDQCAGGCTGTTNKQCLACRNFNNDGHCVEYCPRLIIYKDSKQIKNPEGKLAFHHLCVERCPVKFFNEYGNCVLNCTKPNTYPINETCVECPNGICPKVCHMKDVLVQKSVNFLNRKMLDRLENCTVYDGNIIINMMSFTGDLYHDMTKEEYGIRIEDLRKLSKLQEIYGYLEINIGTYGMFKSLIFLKNLKIIRANNIVANKPFGLSITGSSELIYLGLKSLSEVQNNDIIIRGNKGLRWTRTLTNKTLKHKGKMIIKNNYLRRVAIKLSNGTIQTRIYNDACNSQCDKEYGCWGPSIGLCVRCKHYIATDRSCVPDCSQIIGFFYGNASLTEKKERPCSTCHSQCKNIVDTCFGPGPGQCNHGCKKYSYKGKCVNACSTNHFANSTECIPCHSICKELPGISTTPLCSGPGDFIGDGGCHKCNHVLLDLHQSFSVPNKLTCVNSTFICPNGFFKSLVTFRSADYFSGLPGYLIKNTMAISILRNWFNDKTDHRMGFGSICLPCDPLCSQCNDGSSYCSSCNYYRLNEKCVKKCPTEHFSYSSNETENSGFKECIRCHDECDGTCSGPSDNHCFKCRHVKIFINESDNQFFCNSTCDELYQIMQNSEIVCVPKWRKDQMSWIQLIVIIMSVAIVTLCGLPVSICFIVSLQKKRKYDKKQIKLEEFYQPQNENLIGVQPNMATLLLITESQLTRGDIIGSGAFGVVYKAIWQPNLDKIDKSTSFLKRNLARYSKESSIKLLVAVKVLTDISDPTNNMQLLEEAKVMASVDHSCCLRILGLCLTAHPQLITQFMPLGCLLEFCQKHYSLISNVILLNWAKQISYGMEYLESKGIIHCDLAARNVLVQSPKQVKITDFGLAKILDQSQHQYQSKGGRMPIKWLAIECIKHRVFSSKSDVWSYGVTLWEMFTFGEKPFQNIKAFEILNYLEKGQRLPQPKICSIDVYALMVQCWLVDAESRPTFAELTNHFDSMANNPNRYLLIQTSPEIDSTYSGLEDDALQYDEFLQALVSVPQLNPDYDSLDQRDNDRKNLRSMKNRYKAMCLYKNSFVNYVNEWRDNCNTSNNDYISIVEPEETYHQSLSLWSEYSGENKRLSSSTLVTTVNVPSDYTSVNRIMNSDLSDDGYLIPKSKDSFPKLLPVSESETNVVFSCGIVAEKEILVGHESSL